MRDWKQLLEQGLQEDGWPWDWTALGTLGERANRVVRAEVVAKSPGVWAADPLVDAANQLSRQMGVVLTVRSRARDGSLLRPGQVVCEWSGSARLLLALERPFLNLASYAGGIAFRTRRLVDLVREACPRRTPRVTATRKILPYYRDVALHAVIAGGGHSHRVNLAGGVLIKENHIASAGGIRRALAGARALAPHGLKLEIEVRNQRELADAVAGGAEVVMLDNFTPSEVRIALGKLPTHGRPLIEVSGGISEATIKDYAIPGVDLLSVGGLTHSVQAIDLSLLVRRKGR